MNVIIAPCKLSSCNSLLQPARWFSRVAARCSRPPRGHAWCIDSDQRGTGGKITQRGGAPARVSAGHRWHTARLEARGRSWWGKSEGCGHGAEAVWGGEPPGHWQSIQMEAISQPLQGMACKCTHSLLPTSVPPSHPSDVWMKPSRIGGEMRKGGRGGWCGGGEAGNLYVSFEACLMAFLCQVSLQGHSRNLALEGIRTLTILRLSSSIQPAKSLHWVHGSQHNLWHSGFQ